MAKSIAEHQNMPGFPIVVMEHPVGAESVNLVQEKADRIIDIVVKVLTTESGILEKEFKEKRY